MDEMQENKKYGHEGKLVLFLQQSIIKMVHILNILCS